MSLVTCLLLLPVTLNCSLLIPTAPSSACTVPPLPHDSRQSSHFRPGPRSSELVSTPDGRLEQIGVVAAWLLLRVSQPMLRPRNSHALRRVPFRHCRSLASRQSAAVVAHAPLAHVYEWSSSSRLDVYPPASHNRREALRYGYRCDPGEGR